MLRGAIHVFVRGRCVLFRGSIMYFGVLCQFFIGIHILELYLCIICNFFSTLWHNVFVKCFKKRQIGSLSKQSILVHSMISGDRLLD